MGSAFDEQDGTRHPETPGTGPSGISGLRRRTDDGVGFDAVEDDLRRTLSDLPKLFTERPTRPAPEMTAAMLSGAPDDDWDERTPVRRIAGIIPPPPRAPRPESFAPVGIFPSQPPPPARQPSPTSPTSPTSQAHALIKAALVETRALKSGLETLLRGATIFASVVVVLLVVVVLQTGVSSARSTPVPTPPVTAVRAPAAVKPEMVQIGLMTSPRSAMFRIDDGPWLVGRYEARLPRDDRDHDVYVAAEGYFPRAVKVRFTKDTLFDIVLQQEPASPTRPAGRGF